MKRARRKKGQRAPKKYPVTLHFTAKIMVGLAKLAKLAQLSFEQYAEMALNNLLVDARLRKYHAESESKS